VAPGHGRDGREHYAESRSVEVRLPRIATVANDANAITGTKIVGNSGTEDEEDEEDDEIEEVVDDEDDDDEVKVTGGPIENAGNTPFGGYARILIHCIAMTFPRLAAPSVWVNPGTFELIVDLPP